MERIEIQFGNKKIQIDYDEKTGKHVYTDYIENGLPVVLKQC